MKIKGYQFKSCFAPNIEKFLQEKKDAGFSYNTEEWKLKHFDALCIEEAVSEPIITRELAQKWGSLRDNEALSTCSSRMSVLRQFSFYLTSIGIDTYIPSHFYKSEKVVAHILSDEEVIALFLEMDRYAPKLDAVSFHRLSLEYRVIFRLIYCCGLRISEARLLKWKNVDFQSGAIRILHSKGHKDRLVYPAPDMMELLRSYKEKLKGSFLSESEWVFPARETENCLSVVTLGAHFRRCWKRTSFSEGCDKSPTVHSLRHTFVVKRMNLWMAEGVSIKEMMPFLSRYLGHMSPDETFYYYHQVDAAFRIIRERDKTGSRVIPEVLPYE